MIEKDASQKSNQPFYLPELDILRFFAFFGVFISHAFSHEASDFQKLGSISNWIASVAAAGSFGVDLFFALSSFLITELLIREYEKTEKINAFAFYIRRALRILPLYYTFVLLAIFVFPRLLPYESLGFPYNIGFLTVFANWTCVFFDFPSSVATPLWSISIEEQFYIVFPFLVMFLGVKRLKLLAVIFIIISVLTRIYLVGNNAPPVAIWCNTFARLDPIAGGILLAILIRDGKLKIIGRLSHKIVLIAFSVSIYVLIARYSKNFEYSALFVYPLTALASVLIIWSVIAVKPICAKRYAVLINLGRISYGLYVFHLLTIKVSGLLLERFQIRFGVFLISRFLTALALTIILAIISYNILEKPFLKLKKRFTFIQSRPA